MGKSSKSITLTLLGSALILSGCARAPEEETDEWGQVPADQQAAAGGQSGTVRHHSGGVMIIPHLGGGGYRSAPGPAAPSAGASARGGFGSTGGFSASS